MKNGISIWALCVLLAACGESAPRETAETGTAPAPIAATDLLLRHDGPELVFRWSAAPEAALETGLFNAISADAHQALQAELADATADQASAATGKFPFRLHSFDQHWQAEAETPQLLVLSAQTYSYTGGAHGNIGYSVAIWDRQAGTRIGSWDLFDDQAAAVAALTPQWCEKLDEERARKREGVEAAGFNDCPPLTEQTLVPVGQTTIGQLKAIAAPYSAGPWSEGTYEVLLDPTPVVELVKPGYRAAFVAD